MMSFKGPHSNECIKQASRSRLFQINLMSGSPDDDSDFLRLRCAITLALFALRQQSDTIIPHPLHLLP